MRSTNRSRGAGAAARTASITLSNACGPVIADTFGKASRIGPGSAPMQPVTITRPFSFIASPIAASDSFFALSRKPQVMTITASAPAWLRESSYPSARRRVRIRSLSTSAFGQPSETKEMRGAGRGAVSAMSVTPGPCHGRKAGASAPAPSHRPLRPERHDAGRIDAPVALVIVMLDVEEVDRAGYSRPMVKLAQVAAQAREVPDLPQVALE